MARRRGFSVESMPVTDTVSPEADTTNEGTITMTTAEDTPTTDTNPFLDLATLDFDDVEVPEPAKDNPWIPKAQALTIGGQAKRARIATGPITDAQRDELSKQILMAGRALGDRTVKSQFDTETETDDSGTRVTGTFVTIWAVPKRGKPRSS